MIESRCQARVPDHTDEVDCGDEVLRGGLCALHVGTEVRALSRKIVELKQAIAIHEDRIAELTAESG